MNYELIIYDVYVIYDVHCDIKYFADKINN